MSSSTTSSSSINSLLTWENLVLSLVTLVVVHAISLLVQKKRWVDAINKLPGLSDDELHPIFGHVDTLLNTRGQIPGKPDIADTVGWYLNNPQRRIPKFAADYGLIRVWMFHPYNLLPFCTSFITILDPDLIRQFLTSEKTRNKLIKDKFAYNEARALVGDSFLALPDGPVWKHQRKTAALAFRQDLLENTCSTVHQLLVDYVFPALEDNKKSSGSPPHTTTCTTTIEAMEWSARLTTEVLGLVAFSHSFGSLDDIGKTAEPKQQQSSVSSSNEEDKDKDEEESLYDTFAAILTIITMRMYSHPLAKYFKPAENRRFDRACRKLNGVIGDVIKARMAREEEEEEMKSFVVQGQSSNGAASSSSSNGHHDDPATNGKKQPHSPPRSPSTSRGGGGGGGAKKMDILAHLMARDEETGKRHLDYTSIHGNVRMFFFAGHDTTAVTVAWALWELAVQPDIQQKLQKEVDALFDDADDAQKDDASGQGGGVSPSPSYKQISQLKYLDAVMRETLRMHAPAIIGRTPTEDIQLERGKNTYIIPAGSSVYIIPCYTQVQEAFVKNDPSKFRPERFMGDEEQETMRSYMPFSIGPRNCVGLPLAIAEIKAVLCHVLRRYTIRPSPKQTVPPMPISMLTIKPHEVLVDLERREKGR